MKSTTKILAILMSGLIAFPTFLACAQDAEKKEKEPAEKAEKAEKTDEKAAHKEKGAGIIGKVTITMNDKKKIESITLAGDDGKTYTIPASKGSKLAKESDVEYIEAFGAVSEKKGENGEELILTMTNYLLVFKGTVAATKDGEKLTGVTLGGTDVKLDGKAKEMAEKADGKDVVATGVKTVKKAKDEEKVTITIKTYKIAEATEKKAEKAK